MSNRKKIANQLGAILKDTREEYKRLQERDRMEQARNGAEVIDTRRFIYSENEQEARGIVGRAADRALGIIDKEIEEAGGMLVDAPSTEAANYITAIAARDNLTADEVNAGLARYKDHASQKAIRAAAARSGLRDLAGMTDAEVYLSDLRSLRSDVAKTYTDGFGNISDGFAAVLDGGYTAFAGTPSANAADAIMASGEKAW